MASLREEDIKYENSNYWVLQTPKGTFEVYRSGLTHSTRCAIVGYTGQEGLNRAIAEADRRAKREAIPHVKQKAKSCKPFGVETKPTENWSLRGVYDTKAQAFRAAETVKCAYPALGVRTVEYTG